tara:strand:+ start:1255 stop:1662 length:408 start_codon:yes stop_codon:yes gene_type:complete
MASYEDKAMSQKIRGRSAADEIKRRKKIKNIITKDEADLYADYALKAGRGNVKSIIKDLAKQKEGFEDQTFKMEEALYNFKRGSDVPQLRKARNIKFQKDLDEIRDREKMASVRRKKRDDKWRRRIAQSEDAANR